ncbi:AraC family transcriptional regulator [Niveibacterium sp.]|uniref:AraC family transcriptional regulator n=1 Tax=Niveibacterium sp. TaxID=2017444 RepID=UPI0035AF27BB
MNMIRFENSNRDTADPLSAACESAYLPDMNGSFAVSGAHFRRVRSRWHYPEHEHRQFELNYVVSGRQRIATATAAMSQGPGDLLLITPGEAHESRNEGPGEMAYWCLHFDVDDPGLRQLLCLAGTTVLRAGSPVCNAVAPVIERLIACTRDGLLDGPGARLSTMALLCELLAALASGLQAHGAGSSAPPPAHLQAVGRLARWIEAQVAAPHSEEPIETLIRRTGYSAAHGQALFSRVYGVAPRQYRSRIKLQRACELLRDSSYAIAAVGEALGYADAAHFSRQFKRWCGVSPLQYRRSQGL